MHQLRKEEKINYFEAVAGLAVFLLAFLTDQVSKFYWERSGASFTVNTGIAFGLFQSEFYVFWLEFFFLFVLAGWGVWNYEKKQGGNSSNLGTALVVGGGLSNLFDRVIRGGVLDFLNLGIGPSFNFADCFIMAGVVVLLIPLFGKTFWSRIN